jgi:hypothetical protein
MMDSFKILKSLTKKLTQFLLFIETFQPNAINDRNLILETLDMSKEKYLSKCKKIAKDPS